MTNTAGETTTSNNSGRIFSIIGAVLAVIALLLFPIVFGPIGAILGFVGYAKGDKPFGLYVGVGAIAATIIGIVLGALLLSSQ